MNFTNETELDFNIGLSTRISKWCNKHPNFEGAFMAPRWWIPFFFLLSSLCSFAAPGPSPRPKAPQGGGSGGFDAPTPSPFKIPERPSQGGDDSPTTNNHFIPSPPEPTKAPTFDYGDYLAKRQQEEKRREEEKRKAEASKKHSALKTFELEGAHSSRNESLELATIIGLGQTREEEVTSLIMAMNDLVGDAESDVLTLTYALENDQVLAEAEGKLFAKTRVLYQKQVVPQQEYDEARTRYNKLVSKVEEAKGRLREFEAKVVLYRLRLREAKHEKIPMIDFAKAEHQIALASLDKKKAIQIAAKAEFDYQEAALAIDHKLVKVKASTEAKLIETDREYRQADIALRLANKKLEIANQQVNDAELRVRALEKSP